MSDIARRLGETLLSAEQLTPKQVREAVEQAREESRKAANLREMESLSGQLRFAVRILDREKRVAEVKRIVTRIMEVVE